MNPAGTPMSVASSPYRSRLALALDVDDLQAALKLAVPLQPYFAVAKVGLELFSAAGPAAVHAFIEAGFDVFVDVKLHDIPTTVHNAARVLGRLGARYLTLHTGGGVEMLRAGVEGFASGVRDGAHQAAHARSAVLGVTILTSDVHASPELFDTRVAWARESGCLGVVCAVAEVRRVRAVAPELFVVTPGIRPAGTATNDQARPATPAEAIAAGADLLVIGRAVTHAPDPAAAAARLFADGG
jgi:orotidine-5'-phosphate decarboxylase